MHEKRFNENIERLRSPERMKLLQAEKVVDRCLRDIPAHSTLDVGIGSAVFAEVFVGRGLTVAGVDPNPSMLEISRRHLPEADIREGIAEKLPFDDKIFDIVFLGHVLHETDHPIKALEEARRVSRLRVAALEWPYIREEHGPPLDHRVKSEDVLAWGEAAGFSKVHAEQMKHMVLFLFED